MSDRWARRFAPGERVRHRGHPAGFFADCPPGTHCAGPCRHFDPRTGTRCRALLYRHNGADGWVDVVEVNRDEWEQVRELAPTVALALLREPRAA